MEYPFKDLMPLDEVLEREGYYKDWTHLDPEVFYSLTQISDFIKTKGYGVDVRLLIAQLAEHFGLKTTQVVDLANLLLQKFTNLEGVTQSFTNNINSLVAQMEADKNTIVANATVDSEVILARGGKATLGQRLDDTATQLAETDTKVTHAQYEQEDFIETLLKYYTPKNMRVVPNNFADKNFSIVYELSGGKGIRYLISKNNDAFSILKSGQVGDYNAAANTFNDPVDYLYGTSNKEFAFNLKEKNGTENYFFIPSHGQATSFDASPPKYLVDGLEVSSLTNATATEIKDKFTIIQYLVFYKPNTTTEIAKATVFTVFNKNGRVDINTRFTATVNLDISYGYVNMLPVKSDFAKKMLTSYGVEYPTTKIDGSRTNLSEKDLSKSYVFLSDNIDTSIAVAMTMQKQKQTMRVGKADRPNVAPVWIEHRSSDMQKLYPMPLSNAEMAAGEVYSFGGSYLMAKVEGVNSILG